MCRSFAGLGQGRSRMLDLLDLAAGEVPPEPQLARDAHPEARRMLQVGAAGGLGWTCHLG